VTTRPGVLRSAATVALGAGVGQVILLASSPVLSRIFTPEVFGVFGVATSIESVLVVVAALRYEQAIPLPDDDRAGSALVAIGIGCVAVTTVVSAVLLTLLGPALADWTNTPDLAGYLLLVPLVLFFDGVTLVLSYWAVRQARFGRLSASRLSQAAAQVAGQVGLGAISATPGSLIVGSAAGKVASASVLAANAWRAGQDRVAGVTWSLVRRNARRYRRFPLVSSWSALANSAGLQLPAILAAALFAPAIAGWFLLANRVVAAPMTLFGQASAQAFHGRAAASNRAGEGLRGDLWRLAGQLARLGVLPAVGLVVFGPTLFRVVFGPEWEPAGEYARLLAPAFLAQFVVSPLAPSLAVLERQGWQAGWDLFRLVVVVGSLVVPAQLGWSASDAIALFSAVTVACYVALAVIIDRVVRAADAAPARQ
jgi:O-antigen/teichoic acid export membrane protein